MKLLLAEKRLAPDPKLPSLFLGLCDWLDLTRPRKCRLFLVLTFLLYLVLSFAAKRSGSWKSHLSLIIYLEL
jgi:hypothetical protein